jgi:hypothetical protein
MRVPTMVCERCGQRAVVGVLSSMAWLEHLDGEAPPLRLCPTCQGELTEEQRRAFADSGRLDTA